MVERSTTMSKTLDSILAAPPLQRITPAAREAIASVEALAAQQAADLPASASPFEAIAPETEVLSCSFEWSPSALKLDLNAPQKVIVDAAKLGAQFSITIRF
jgi:hypothetical protein